MIAKSTHAVIRLSPIEQVTWCWLLGATMCFTLGTPLLQPHHVWKPMPWSFTGSSIAEIVSAFPTCGGLYTASAQLCPRKHRPIVGWVVGWLNILGQAAGVSSTEFGLANMIWAAVSIANVSSWYSSDRSEISDSHPIHNRTVTSPLPLARRLAYLPASCSSMVSLSVEL